uniref:Protein TIC 214 n=1 Tax=Mammillaria supertexta TaxID=278583 RepID=A0A5J6VB84_9CARY|nr:Ycf1 protein [Mammillaria supertexta]
MILQSFQLGNLASLYMRIINSVVVVGLYYGFLSTFSIGPSYLLLLQAHIKAIEEGEKEIEKEVSAATGFIVGQLLIFVSIYYTPLHLALGGPHTITFLVPFCLLLLYYRYNSENFSQPTRQILMHNPTTQCIFLINLLFQLLNHFFFPSSMLARLVNIYTFRYNNNKMLFVTSSFVGWLIGQILFMKWVRFVLVWLQQNYLVRAKRYIFSNEYLFYAFRFYRNVIFDLRMSMDRFSSILVFFICLCTFGRMPLPLLTYKIKPEMQEEKAVELNPEEEEEKKRIAEVYHGDEKIISKFKIDKEDSEIPLWFDKAPLTSILFDYNRWNRPMRHIRNIRFKKAVRDEMSQFYFHTYPNDGKLRISFSCPPSLADFWQILQRTISFFQEENDIHDKLDDYNYWTDTNEKKMESLRREFSKRIAVLDKKGLEKINVFENKIRLCKDQIKKEYLPFRHDPFLNGPYRGIIRGMCIPEMRTLSKNKESLESRKNPRVFFYKMILPISKSYRPRKKKSIININKILILLSNDYLFNRFDQKIARFFKRSLLLYVRYFSTIFRNDCLISWFLGEDDECRKEILKEVPHWPYRLFYETEKDKLKEKQEKEKEKQEKEKQEKEKQEKEKQEKEEIEEEEEKQEKEEIEEEEKNGKKEKEPETQIRDIPIRRTLHLETIDEEGEVDKQIILTTYMPGPHLRELIKGSVRAQKRKTGVWLLCQTHEHSKFFLNRTDSLFNGFVHFFYVIKGIFLKYMRKISEFELSAYYPSFADLFISIEESGEEESGIDDEKYTDDDKNKLEEKIRAAEKIWEDIVFGHRIRSNLLIIHLFIRREIIQPLLIIAKNIGRILLLQRPEFSEDFKDYKEERHLYCTYNGVPFSDTDFPETWKDEGVQIMIVYPFRLKPWHRSRPSDRKRREDSFYLTAWGLRTSVPFGLPEAPEIKPFFKPIFKKLYKISKKIRKHFAKWIFFIQNSLFNLFIQNGLEKILLKKNLSNVNPNFELELRDKSSEIKKENNSIINNQMIHESSIESQFKNLTKNYSLTERRMKNLANRRSRIRNQMDQISKIFNISPNKKHYGVKRLESLQNFVQILKRRTARLIRKSGYFIEFFMEKIYVDIFLYIKNISRIYTQKFFLEFKKMDRVQRTNRNPIQFISTIKKSHFLFSSLLSSKSKINKNSRSHSDLSFLSQAYVFYKISQAQLSNLYKLRSVFQYNGTSLFLKNEIKDYFGAQGIIHSELRTKKLPNSGMNQWKNWLKSNYQYALSQETWSALKKRRNKINEYCRGQNNTNKKCNSYEKEQLINSNYQNAKAPLLLLPDPQENWKKNLKFQVLSYKFLFLGDKKDLDSYRIPFQGNQNKELSYTKNAYKFFNNTPQGEKLKEKEKEDDYSIFYGKEKSIYKIEKEIEKKEKKNMSEREREIYEIEKEIEEKEKDMFFLDEKDQFCDEIHKKEKEKYDQTFKKKNFFDWWMKKKKSEPILSPRPPLEFWFFPEFVSPYNRYKKKPWTIPIDLLFSTYEYFPLKKRKKLADKQKQLADKQKQLADKQKQLADRTKIREDIIPVSYYRFLEQKRGISMGDRLINKDFLCFQLDSLFDYEDSLSNIDRYIFMHNLKMSPEKEIDFFLSSIKWGDFNLDILVPKKDEKREKEEDEKKEKKKDEKKEKKKDEKKEKKKDGKPISISNLVEEGIITIEPIRTSNNEGSLIMYQMTGLSWVQKNLIKYKNNQKRFGDENNYDLLIPENILSPRRRRELRILSLLNSRNNKGVDKNPVYCNGNRVNKGSQFFDKSKDLDRDKKKLIKFFLWPNYRLEDLACMNRYWFDTNNGSRFSILRIRMYPRLKTHLFSTFLRYSLSSSR